MVTVTPKKKQPVKDSSPVGISVSLKEIERNSSQSSAPASTNLREGLRGELSSFPERCFSHFSEVVAHIWHYTPITNPVVCKYQAAFLDPPHFKMDRVSRPSALFHFHQGCCLPYASLPPTKSPLSFHICSADVAGSDAHGTAFVHSLCFCVPYL